MIRVLPNWITEASENLDKCVDEIARKNGIDFHFVNDSVSIRSAKEEILGNLLTIKEQVKNPFNPTEEEEQSLMKEVKEEVKATWKRGSSRGRPRKVRKIRYPVEMEEFIKENINKANNSELVELVKDRFGVITTKARIANYMAVRGIKREY